MALLDPSWSAGLALSGESAGHETGPTDHLLRNCLDWRHASERVCLKGSARSRDDGLDLPS
jgi:hypothetical protein